MSLRDCFRSLLVLVGMITLSACSTLSSSDVARQNASATSFRADKWQIKGKIAVNTTQNAALLNIIWRQDSQRYQIVLTAPFGVQGARIEGDAKQVEITFSNGKILRGTSPENLLQHYFKLNLPISYLKFWVLGQPVPGVRAQTFVDALHRLVELKQNGWVVQYTSYTKTNSMFLPKQLLITAPGFKIKVVVYEWQIH